MSRAGVALAPRRDLAGQLKRDLVDIPAVLRLLGRSARRDGTSWKISCPWHDEQTPSCSVRIGDRGELVAYCFGCNRNGSVIDLAAAVLGYELPADTFEACLELARRAGRYDLLDAAPDSFRLLPSPVVAAPTAKKIRPSLSATEFQAVVADLLAGSPLQGDLALGLFDAGLLEEARHDRWGELPADRRKSGEEARRDAAAGFDTEDLALSTLSASLAARHSPAALAWLFRGKAINYEAHRLLIPWCAPDGSVWSLQRRYAPVTGREEPPSGPKYLWPSSTFYEPPACFAYGVDRPELATADEVWLCEGAVDVLAVRALGKLGSRPRVALGIPGVGSWDKYKASILPHLAGRLVHVALDDDAAGNGGVDRVVADLKIAKVDRAVRVLPSAVLPNAKDWAQVAQSEWRKRGQWWPR